MYISFKELLIITYKKIKYPIPIRTVQKIITYGIKNILVLNKWYKISNVFNYFKTYIKNKY